MISVNENHNSTSDFGSSVRKIEKILKCSYLNETLEEVGIPKEHHEKVCDLFLSIGKKYELFLKSKSFYSNWFPSSNTKDINSGFSVGEDLKINLSFRMILGCYYITIFTDHHTQDLEEFEVNYEENGFDFKAKEAINFIDNYFANAKERLKNKDKKCL